MRHQCGVRALCVCAGLAAASAASGQAIVTNGSFETGDFTGWTVIDIPGVFDPAFVLPGGTPTAFDGFLGPNVVIPTDGGFAANHGFDGDGMPSPGEISISQDIGTPLAGELLAFDFRAGWDLISFVLPGALDRFFDVVIEPAGGGAPLGIFPQLTAAVGTDTFGGPNSDTGPLSGLIDLTPFAGTSIRVNFLWTIPDAFSGPANAQLDNVHIIPAPSALALLGLGGLAATRRRR